MSVRAIRRGINAALLLGGTTFALVFGWQVAERTRLEAPAATPILYDRHGTFLSQIGRTQEGDRIDYGYWPLTAVPDRVARATLALEDRRFDLHPGVDPVAILRASWNNLTGGHRRSGASTIAMQVARMQRPAPRTLWNKSLEAATALGLTARYGREAILAHYLRLVPYGNGSHGIAHAARWYLDKPVGDLSWSEIALLSSLPQAPATMNPWRPSGRTRAIGRGDRILDALAAQGVIGPAELAVAHEQLAAIHLPDRPRRPEMLHAVLRLAQTIERDGVQGLSASDPRVLTSLDLGLETKLGDLMRGQLKEWRAAGAGQAALMVVDRKSREVLAALGSADYAGSQDGAIDFTRTLRSPGSTLKPFIYALALERGTLRADQMMTDLPEGASGIGNADGRFLGPLLPRQALANSRNVPATNLLRSIGLETGFRFLRTLGLHDLDVPAEEFGLSMAIGSLPTSLDRLVRAYGALADDGMIADPVWYAGQPRREPVRVLSEDTARLITLFLADPMARLPSFPRFGTTEYPFPVALKTGTSQGYRDAWLMAWSADYLIGVWVGRGDAGTMTQLSGARSAAKLGQAVMLALHGTRPGDLDDHGFAPPPGRVPVELCAFTGSQSASECGQTLQEWLPPAAVIASASAIAPAHRAWAKANRYQVPAAVADPAGPVSLSIVTPEQNSRLWRNPDVPARLNRVALKVVTDPPVPQVVWYVDGEPFMVADADQPVYWTLTPGAHQFQARLPLREGASRPVRIVVE